MKVVYREQALADLAAIAEYHIARGSFELAAAIICEIEKAILLRTHSALHKAARLNPRTETYEIVIPRLPYIVAYCVTDSMLDVLAVSHTSSKPSARRASSG